MNLTVQESVQKSLLQNVCISVVELKIVLSAPAPWSANPNCSSVNMTYFDLNNGIKIVTIYKSSRQP
jgi:hypothetical protein